MRTPRFISRIPDRITHLEPERPELSMRRLGIDSAD